MIQIDYRSQKAIYEQVRDELKKLIMRGVLRRDEKIPSVREIAGSLAINPNTVQRAYRELENEGFIYSVKGKGNFVSDSTLLLKQYREEITERFREICREAAAAGIPKAELSEIVEQTKG